MPVDRKTSGGYAWRVGVVLVSILAFVVVLVLYGRSTRPDQSANVPPDPSAQERAAVVLLEVAAIDALNSTITGTLRVNPSSALTKNSRTRDTITVTLVNLDSGLLDDRSITQYPLNTNEIVFDQGQLDTALTAEVTLRADGNFQDYPFDVFRSEVIPIVTVGDAKDDDVISSTFGILGGAPGWIVRELPLLDSAQGQELKLDLGATEDDTSRAGAGLYVARAGSTKTFVILLLAAMITLAAMGLLVARAVAKKRRRIEATMASWFAAMLFALIPLRINMPGSPPIGVWIDFLVLLWVELGLMIGIAIFIGSWLRYTPRPEYAPEPEQAVPEREPIVES